MQLQAAWFPALLLGFTRAQGMAALGEAPGPPALPGRSLWQHLSLHCQRQGLLEGGTELFVAWEGGRKVRGFPVQLQFSPSREEV